MTFFDPQNYHIIFCLTTILILNSVTSEWVELPQFSNDHKVYRVPEPKPNIKLPSHSWTTKRPSWTTWTPPNTTMFTQYSRLKNKFSVMTTPKKNEFSTWRNDFTLVNVTQDPFEDIEATTLMTKFYSIKHNMNSNYHETMTETTPHPVQINNDESKKSGNTSKLYIIGVETGLSNDPNAAKQGSTVQSFFYYLPLQLFKTVHNILIKAHSNTVAKKFEYLNSIKKTLFDKIELIANAIVKPTRKKRGAWDGDEHHMGFPSLEGALLAISFLTFSVYLIQLVMMLMRNIGTFGTGTTTGTVVLNRNKRFINLDNAIKVCEYIDKYTYQH